MTTITEKNVEESIEKIYAINAKRKTKEGEKYIYKNYRAFIPYMYLETMNITDHMYIYRCANRTYLTSVQPDGSVPARRLSLQILKDKKKNTDNRWKRIFTIPKYFYPNITEKNRVLYSLDTSEVEQFSKVNATLKIDII